MKVKATHWIFAFLVFIVGCVTWRLARPDVLTGRSARWTDERIRDVLDARYGDVTHSRVIHGVLLPPSDSLCGWYTLRGALSSSRPIRPALWRRDYFISHAAVVPWLSIQVIEDRVYGVLLGYDASADRSELSVLHEAAAATGLPIVEWQDAQAAGPPLLGITRCYGQGSRRRRTAGVED